MNAKTVVILSCLVALAVGRPDSPPAPVGYGYEEPEHPLSYHAPEKHEGMPFDFAYDVKDSYKGVDFGHNSNSDGKVVTGEYRVVLPDGRTQIVTYTADHYNGYQAEVRYEGEAQYPEPKPYAPSPSYGAPKPTYGAPEPTYEEPDPVYGTPAPTYEEPKALYGAPDH
ncbi:cuticle protein 7-like isoform X2 [Macrobrachium nipponense]|uniref:cuticle protein 7-like isoform X2 n=1 Tax=Macrobrachium nipponense TaxID=159736 RepID=UPI0030C80C0B